mgnify:CR=1
TPEVISGDVKRLQAYLRETGKSY